MAMYKYLFNFSVSYTGGGLKRLVEFSRWFDSHKGAHFIVHPSCEYLQEQFTNNRYYLIKHSTLDRITNRSSYLDLILAKCGDIQLYYSYGIPLQRKIAAVNWYHLSNVLPLLGGKYCFGLFEKLRFIYLGGLIRRCLNRCDMISAESRYSLSLLPDSHATKFALSINGSDDEIAAFFTSEVNYPLEDIAVVLGTHKYKALRESYAVFKFLELHNPGLRLVIIGNKVVVPPELCVDPKVDLVGMQPRADVYKLLKQAKYYISTTKIENSFNAASEGIFLAPESYISSIPPHLELLEGLSFEETSIDGVSERLLHVHRNLIDVRNLRKWSDIVEDMVIKVEGHVS